MNEPNLRTVTEDCERDYVQNIFKDMQEHSKHWYTNAYDYKGKQIRITVEVLEPFEVEK